MKAIKPIVGTASVVLVTTWLWGSYSDMRDITIHKESQPIHIQRTSPPVQKAPAVAGPIETPLQATPSATEPSVPTRPVVAAQAQSHNGETPTRGQIHYENGDLYCLYTWSDGSTSESTRKQVPPTQENMHQACSEWMNQ